MRGRGLFKSAMIVCGLAALASCVTVQPSQRIAISQKDSLVSFDGDDSFVTQRYRMVPPSRNMLNEERMHLNDGVIQFYELLPHWHFTRGGPDSESRDLVGYWQKEKVFASRGLIITRADVKGAANKYGDYYYAVKGDAQGACGYVRQVFGSTLAEGIMSTGTHRVNVIGCARGDAQAYETFLRDVMARIRFDGGELNRMKTLARASSSSSRSPVVRQRDVVVAWQGETPRSAVLQYEDAKAGGALTIWLENRNEPCKGSWAPSSAVTGGTWTVSCPENLSASGVYKVSSGGKSVGSGTDSSGKVITFSFDS